MTPIVGTVVGGVFDLVKDWIKRKFPDPKEQLAAEQDFARYMQGKNHEELQQFYEFVTKYEGEGKDVSPELQLYRGSVRPTITYFLVIALVYGIFDNWAEIYITLLYKLNLISLGFWYGERALKNLGLDINNVFGKKKATIVE